MVQNLSANVGLIPGLGRALEEKMTTQSRVFLVGKILWSEEPGGLQYWGHRESNETEQLSMHTGGHTAHTVDGQSLLLLLISVPLFLRNSQIKFYIHRTKYAHNIVKFSFYFILL